MNLYALFLILFGITSVIGVPMLSFIQYLFIHKMSIDSWLTGLPTTIAISIVLIIIIGIIVRIYINPVLKVLKKAETQEISNEEKFLFMPAFKKIKMITYILLYVGYVIGNGGVVLLKSMKGKVDLGATPEIQTATFIMIIGLCLCYATIAVFYTTNFFEIFAQKWIRTLNISDIGDQKTSRFTMRLMTSSIACVIFIGWHVLCAGYGIARFPEREYDIHDFFSVALPILGWGIAVSIPLMGYMLLNLRKRFEATSNQVTSLREKGDLVTRLKIDSFDDFGRINSEMNKLMAKLYEIISEVTNENKSVNSNAGNLLGTAEENLTGIQSVVSSFSEINTKNSERDDLLKNTQQNIIQLDQDAEKISGLVSQQASAIAQNASAITEMVANINSMTEMIKKARVVATDLSKVSEKGSTEVASTLNLIEAITENSQRMSEITQMISSVASETNLLAMNAAIEAAHAGEAGAGFSVVADEIRKLAESTSNSTKEIKDLINGMVKVVDESSQSMQATSAVFKTINNGVKETTQFVETISNAMEEQSIGASETLNVTTQISSQIAEINQLVKNQSDYNGKIKDDIGTIVDLSASVNSSLNNSNKVVNDFESAMNNICTAAQENQESVSVVTEKLNNFKLN